MSATARYAVFGNPIAHSKSPQIHQMFAAQEGVSIEYTRILSTEEQIDSDLKRFFAEGGSGCNITVPFKTQAYAAAAEHSPRARTAGAANTLMPLADGSLYADNTDGPGLVLDIVQRLAVPLRGQNILILGAGGAVRGVLQPLAEQQPAGITLANRTADKAQELAGLFGIEALPFDQLPAGHYDIIINATSGGLNGEIPPVDGRVYSACRLAYDMVYGNEPTAFMRFAQAHGAAQTADGLGMLVAQAAASYQLWRGFSPDIAAVTAALQEAV